MSGGGRLEVLQGGAGCTVQDCGRPGHRHQGVAVSGWLDDALAGAANALAGNPPDAACLEWRGPGLVLRVAAGPVRIGVAGGEAARSGDDGTAARPLPRWAGAILQPGERLHLAPRPGGVACLALGGGVQVPAVLGSRSTHVRTRMGGVAGRMLRPGDALPCDRLAEGDTRVWRADSPPDWDAPGPIRVILGPQDDHFLDPRQLLDTPWRVTPELDRMGMRLDGPPLAHRGPGAADIVSDGVVPGAIQVPADGRPIVLLADAQTVGGYPKIATVIRADLPRLAGLPPGATLRFEATDAEAARRALAARLRRWRAWCDALRPGPAEGWLDLDALHRANLVSGCIRAEP